MKFLKQSQRPQPKVSLVLLDWSVRESFHLLHYLARQDVPRDDFEVMIIEYYSRESEALRKFEQEVDTWLLLEMPEDCYYHKHLMYNAGIALARGEICVICDSDAMVKPGFIRAIIEAFEREPKLVLHLDQFRNNRRDLYPFNYPSFEEVEGEGCINNAGGVTRGILEVEDPIHARNYGACMCARRADLIAIGGADEHIDFLGHICGPYDMTFRLFNRGWREVWHPTEFMYHTWHPGQAGADNYLGPHDGRHVSTTAIEALISRRTMPLVENRAIRALRLGAPSGFAPSAEEIIAPGNRSLWRRENVEGPSPAAAGADARTHYYKGYRIRGDGDRFHASLLIEPPADRPGCATARFEARSLQEARERIDRALPGVLGAALSGGRLYVLARLLLGYTVWRAVRRLLGMNTGGVTDGHRPSGAGAGAAVGLFVARLNDRFRQFRQEVSWLADSLADIVASLFFLEQARPGSLQRGTPVLLVESHRFDPYLRLLAALRVIPRVRLEWVRTSTQLQAFLARADPAGGDGMPFIARSIYVRYYPLFAAGDGAKSVTIL